MIDCHLKEFQSSYQASLNRYAEYSAVVATIEFILLSQKLH